MPCCSSADVIIATRAPAIIAFSTSSAVWTPPVTARSACMCPYRIATQCSRSSSSCERAQREVRHHLQVLQIEVGLVEAVEQHQAVGARLVQPRARLARALKNGPSLTATGMRTLATHVADQIDVHLLDLGAADVAGRSA